jgi:hypothetical protein
MSAKHPHDAEIRAWLDGKVVQCERDGPGKWLDMPTVDDFTCAPMFSRAFRFRIKPQTIRYRVAMWNRDGVKEATCCHPSRYEPFAEHPNFIRWLGDEQEVEVTP